MLKEREFFPEELTSQFVGKGMVDGKLFVTPGSREKWEKDVLSKCSHGSHTSHSSK